MKFIICNIIFFLYKAIWSYFYFIKYNFEIGIVMYKNLSNNFKKELRKKAYSLKPFVIVGQHGLTEAVIAEINVALNAHELIKIRIRETDKNKRSKQCIQIQKHLSAEIIHEIGFIIVLYRPKPENL